MPSNYGDAYAMLDVAQKHLDGLESEESREERYASIRLAFHYMYQGMRIAAMLFETSVAEGAAAQGGKFTRMKDELNDFYQSSKRCHLLMEGNPSGFELAEACAPWMNRAKSYVAWLGVEEPLLVKGSVTEALAKLERGDKDDGEGLRY